LVPAYTAEVAAALRERGFGVQLLPELDGEDIICGQLHCNNDLCYHLISVAGQAIRWAQSPALAESLQRSTTRPEVDTQSPALAESLPAAELPPAAQSPPAAELLPAAQSLPQLEPLPAGGAEQLLIPQICMDCRGASLEALIKAKLAAIGAAGRVTVHGLPLEGSELDAATPKAAAHDVGATPTSALKAAPAVGELGEPGEPGEAAAAFATKVAVLGNAALLYTPYLNNDIAAEIRADGCQPLFAPLSLIANSSAPLRDSLPWVAEQGIRDVIYVQSFGCLSSHIHGRGAIKRLRARYPDINVTFLDYDPGTSAINQLNRLKLALAIAKERTTGS
jgi:hypothetical protein